jgi:hypothetical protein
MSIASEISRLQTAKSDIKTAIELNGVTVPSSATIDTYDDYVSQISGGGDTPSAFTSWEYDDWGKPTSIVLKNGVTNIPNRFQYYNGSLTSCTIPSSVTTIGEYAFSQCQKLTSLTITSAVTSIKANAFSYVGFSVSNDRFDVSNIDLSRVSASTDFSYVFTGANLHGSITIPNSLLSGATSGYSSTCYQLFNSAAARGAELNIDVYADGVVIPKNMFGFSSGSNYSDGLNLTIHGTPTFLSRNCICCSSGGTVTFADCTTPPDAESYGTTNTSPFYNFKGTLYVPSAGLTAWQTKYTGIASSIQAIPNS